MADEKAAKAQDESKLALPQAQTKPLEGTITGDEKFGYLAELVARRMLERSAAHIAGKVSDSLSAEQKKQDEQELATPDSSPHAPTILVVRDLNVAAGDIVWTQVSLQIDLLQQLVTKHLGLCPSAEPAKAAPGEPEEGAKGVLGEVAKGGVGAAAAIAGLVAAGGSAVSGVGVALAALPALVGAVADVAGYFKTDLTIKGKKFGLTWESAATLVAGQLRLNGRPVLVDGFDVLPPPKTPSNGQSAAGPAPNHDILLRYLHLWQDCLRLEQCKTAISKVQIADAEAKITEAKAAIAKMRAYESAATLDEAQQALAAQESNRDKWQRIVAEADVLLTAFTKFTEAVTKPGDGQQRPMLAQAILREHIRRQNITHLLWLQIASDGGEVITEKQTFFHGGEAAFMGGLAVDYILADADAHIIAADSERVMGFLSADLTSGATHGIHVMNLDIENE